MELCQDCGGWACVRLPSGILAFCLPCYAYRRIRVLLSEGAIRLPRLPYDAK